MPSMRLCADNAATIALVGAWQLREGLGIEPEMDAVASLEASGLDRGA